MEAHQGILNKVCHIYTRSETDFNDLHQEILLQLWRAFPRYRGEAKLSTWIYRIALNTAISGIRRKERQKVDPLDPAHLPDQGQMDQAQESLEKKTFLYRAIDQLNPTEKAIIMLYLEEHAYEDIAQIMGLTRNHVGVKINRIKQKLKIMLQNHL